MIDDEEMGGGAAAGDGNDSDNGGDADVEGSSGPPAPDAEGSDAAAAGGGGSSSRGRKRRQGGGASAAAGGGHAMARAPSKAQTKMVHSCIVKVRLDIYIFIAVSESYMQHYSVSQRIFKDILWQIWQYMDRIDLRPACRAQCPFHFVNTNF